MYPSAFKTVHRTCPLKCWENSEKCWTDLDELNHCVACCHHLSPFLENSVSVAFKALYEWNQFSLQGRPKQFFVGLMKAKMRRRQKIRKCWQMELAGCRGENWLKRCLFLQVARQVGGEEGRGEMRRRRERKSEGCISQHFLDAHLYNFFCAGAADTMQTSQLGTNCSLLTVSSVCTLFHSAFCTSQSTLQSRPLQYFMRLHSTTKKEWIALVALCTPCKVQIWSIWWDQLPEKIDPIEWWRFELVQKTKLMRNS